MSRKGKDRQLRLGGAYKLDEFICKEPISNEPPIIEEPIKIEKEKKTFTERVKQIVFYYCLFAVCLLPISIVVLFFGRMFSTPWIKDVLLWVQIIMGAIVGIAVFGYFASSFCAISWIVLIDSLRWLKADSFWQMVYRVSICVLIGVIGYVGYMYMINKRDDPKPYLYYAVKLYNGYHQKRDCPKILAEIEKGDRCYLIRHTEEELINKINMVQANRELLYVSLFGHPNDNSYSLEKFSEDVDDFFGMIEDDEYEKENLFMSHKRWNDYEDFERELRRCYLNVSFCECVDEDMVERILKDTKKSIFNN